MRTYIIGDIHGSARALRQCLERVDFNADSDRLIVLGDVCDGYPEVRESIDILLSLADCTMVIGNHDLWTLEWARFGVRPRIWTSQGGIRTIDSYHGGPMPPEHVDFLARASRWIELDGSLFVHGGIDPELPLAEHALETLVWDRSLLDRAVSRERAGRPRPFGSWKSIFIGHTTTELYGTTRPIHACNVWALDTGAGWSGPLTIMDFDTGAWIQSDPSAELYPGVRGRR